MRRATPRRAVSQSGLSELSELTEGGALPALRIAGTVTTGHYSVEDVDLTFSNGAQRRYERLHSRHGESVIIAAIPAPGTVLLVREYAVGVERYEWGLPKGRIDPGETLLEAADRELKEETGHGARRLTYLRPITLAPTYMSNAIHLVLAEELYLESLVGDEPEPLEVAQWPLERLDALMLREDVSESRSLAALFITRELLLKR